MCPANVWRLRTMNHPMAPDTTATMVPARNAFTMKGYKAIVPDLSAEEEAAILGFLKQAREQAVDFA